MVLNLTPPLARAVLCEVRTFYVLWVATAVYHGLLPSLHLKQSRRWNLPGNEAIFSDVMNMYMHFSTAYF